jgi:predicted ribosome quality control (RQC) complex YloA/Tae2 family protein
LYRKAKLRNDVPAMARNCDSIVTEYETYRYACDSYVQEADSIMSNMYIVNQRQDQIIKELNGVVEELSLKYMESQSATMIAATGEQAEQRKKKRWRRISIILASVIGLNLITR